MEIYKTILLSGGPLDGETREVPNYIKYVFLPFINNSSVGKESWLPLLYVSQDLPSEDANQIFLYSKDTYSPITKAQKKDEKPLWEMR